ncbi:MAG: PD40 domain-containing protein [Candidatus Latescibacteria bacterium]|nr:PD40 domain-containing protein [Candidatus Latescibacterota bacterium]
MIQKILLCAAFAVAVLTSPSQAQLPGGRIAYVSLVANPNSGMQFGSICVMDLDGENKVALAQAKFDLGGGDGVWPLFPIAWSPDGTRLAYQSGNNIYAVGVAGGVPVNLTNIGPKEAAEVRHPAWSPDGTHIAFTSIKLTAMGKLLTDIYVMNADGSNPVDLMEQQPEAANSIDQFPAWSPDGHQIAFRSNRAGGKIFNIFAMNADGTDPVQLTHETTNDCGSVAWSPDGRRIAFDVALKGDKPRLACRGRCHGPRRREPGAGEREG